MTKTESAPKNCYTCAFRYKCNKGKSEYCSLKQFPILNPDIGCGRHMYKSEFTSSSFRQVTPEEITAYAEATFNELKESGIKDPCANSNFDI